MKFESLTYYVSKQIKTYLEIFLFPKNFLLNLVNHYLCQWRIFILVPMHYEIQVRISGIFIFTKKYLNYFLF